MLLLKERGVCLDGEYQRARLRCLLVGAPHQAAVLLEA